MISAQRFEEITSNFKNQKPILVIGDVGVDKYTLGKVERISPEAPVPVITVNKEWAKLGLAANVSDNLRSLDSDSTLCSIIGDDINASILENLLEETGLKTWGIIRSKERMTTFKERVTTQTQQICRVDYESSQDISQDLEEKLLDRINNLGDEHDLIILQDYNKGLLTKNICQDLFTRFNERRKPIFVDPSRYGDPLKYKGATLFKPNKQEADLMAQFFGVKNKPLDEMANCLVERLEIEKLVITLGAEGMALLDTKGDGQLKMIPTLATEVFDVSGAGDTVISVMSLSILAGANLEEAAWISNCAAGVVVGKQGTAKVNPNELKKFYDKLRENLS